MRDFMVILCAVALAALAGQTLAAPVLEGPASLSLPAAGSTGTVAISLAGAGTGLSGYNLTLSLAPAGTAEIVSVDFPSWARMPANGTLPASSTYLQAVDLEMHAEPGASPIILVNVTLRAITGGATVLAAVPVIVDDDRGGRYTLDPLQIPVLVDTVPAETATPGTVPVSSSAAVPSSTPSTTSNAPPSPVAPLPSGAVENVTTAGASLSPSPPVVTPDGEQTMPPTEAAPGFDVVTACFAGLLISVLTLLKRKPW